MINRSKIYLLIFVYFREVTKLNNETSRSFAEESMPAGLELKIIDEEHGKSVVARAPIAQYTKFGPIVGPQIHEKDISDESDMRHIWEVGIFQ